MKNRIAKLACIISLAIPMLTSCMGQMAVTQKLTEVNLKAVDNRYGRAGLYVIMSPAYGITSVADLFIFNTVEFWTGKNPISGKSPALVDTPASSAIKVNNKVGPSFSKVPLQSYNTETTKAEKAS